MVGDVGSSQLWVGCRLWSKVEGVVKIDLAILLPESRAGHPCSIDAMCDGNPLSQCSELTILSSKI